MPQLSIDTPLGSITLIEQAGRIAALDWGRCAIENETSLLAAAAQQLNAYFYCGLQAFELPLAPAGTAFQQAVWQDMLRIPFGRTRSYGDLAHTLDSGPRAIGTACGRNPIPIIIPCHRILAGGGRIGGYSSPGGVETKRFLLALEGAPVQS